MGILEQIQAVDEQAADWVATLRASADFLEGTQVNANWRGVMMGKFNAHGIDDESRHVFCRAVTGHESSKDMAPHWWAAIARWLDDGGARMVPRIVDAVNRADGQQELFATDELVQAATEELGAAVVPDEGKEQRNVNGAQVHEQTPQAAAQDAPPVEHTEARVLAWARLFDPNGVEWSVTIREGVTGEMAVDIADKCSKLSGYLIGHGWSAKFNGNGGNGHNAPARIQQAVSSAPAPQGPPQPPPPPQASYGGNGGNGSGNGGSVQRGTGRLEQLTINPDGKVEFKLSTLRYPLKDARGPQMVASLFSEELQVAGWNAQLLSTPAIYTPAHFGDVNVDWEKPGKYYDVARVYPA